MSHFQICELSCQGHRIWLASLGNKLVQAVQLRPNGLWEEVVAMVRRLVRGWTSDEPFQKRMPSKSVFCSLAADCELLKLCDPHMCVVGLTISVSTDLPTVASLCL